MFRTRNSAAADREAGLTDWREPVRVGLGAALPTSGMLALANVPLLAITIRQAESPACQSVTPLLRE